MEKESAYANFDEGVIEYFNRNYREAIGLFDKQISLMPEMPEVFLYRGNAKFVLDDIRGACADWRKALELGSKEAVKYARKYC